MILEYDNKKEIYTLRGHFGYGFKSNLIRMLGTKKAFSLFINIKRTEVSFYSFFALEVAVFFEQWLETEYPTFGTTLVEVEKSLKRLQEETWLANRDTVNSVLDYGKIKSELKFNILPHQESAFKFYLDMKKKNDYLGGLLAAEPGTGKTFISIALSVALNADKVIIVAPLPTISTVWENSLKNTIFKTPQNIFGTKNFSKGYNNEKYTLCHYEALGKLLPFVKKIAGVNTAIIVDEAHNFNERKSKRANELVEICKLSGSENIILLSGTPIKAKPLEVMPMLRMLDPRFNSFVEKRFTKIYSSPNWLFKDTLPLRYGLYTHVIKKEILELPEINTEYIDVTLPNGEEYTLEAVKEKMLVFYTNRKKEILSRMEFYVNDYTRLRDEAFTVAFNKSEVTENQFAQYKLRFKEIQDADKKNKLSLIPDTLKEVNEFEKTVLMHNMGPEDKKLFREAKSILKYLDLKLRGEMLGKVFMGNRMACHRDMGASLDFKAIKETTTKKVLVFTSYIEVAEACVKKGYSQGLSPLGVFGNQSNSLTQTVNMFTSEPSHKMLVATYPSLATGVPVTVANVVVIVDTPFRTYIYNQAISRVHRLGQDKPVTVFNLRLETGEKKNLNSRGIDILSWSKDAVAEITGETSEFDVPQNLVNLHDSVSEETSEELAKFFNTFTKIKEKVKAKTSHLSQW